MLRSFAKCTTEHEASSRLIAGNACLRFTMTRSNARGAIGARFISAPTDLHAVSQWLGQNGWRIVTSELGYLAKSFPELGADDRQDVGEFLQALEDHDDVHRVWAAVR